MKLNCLHCGNRENAKFSATKKGSICLVCFEKSVEMTPENQKDRRAYQCSGSTPAVWLWRQPCGPSWVTPTTANHFPVCFTTRPRATSSASEASCAGMNIASPVSKRTRHIVLPISVPSSTTHRRSRLAPGPHGQPGGPAKDPGAHKMPFRAQSPGRSSCGPGRSSPPGPRAGSVPLQRQA